jgi:hypothetical protein
MRAHKDHILLALIAGRELSGWDIWSEFHTSRASEYIRRLRDEITAVIGGAREDVIMSEWETTDDGVRYVRYSMPRSVAGQLAQALKYRAAREEVAK